MLVRGLSTKNYCVSGVAGQKFVVIVVGVEGWSTDNCCVSGWCEELLDIKLLC